MGEFLTLAIGWAVKKALDLLWGGAVWVAAWTKSKLSLRLVDKKKLADLEHKAKCLEVLTKAYDQLQTRHEPGKPLEEGRPQWRH